MVVINVSIVKFIMIRDNFTKKNIFFGNTRSQRAWPCKPAEYKRIDFMILQANKIRLCKW